MERQGRPGGQETREQRHGDATPQASWPRPGHGHNPPSWEHPLPSGAPPTVAAPGSDASTYPALSGDPRPGPSQTLQLLRTTHDAGQPGQRRERPRALLYKLALGFQAICLRRWPAEFHLDLEQMEHVIRIPLQNGGYPADTAASLSLWHRIEQRVAPASGEPLGEPIQALLVWAHLDAYGQVTPALSTDLDWAGRITQRPAPGQAGIVLARYASDLHDGHPSQVTFPTIRGAEDGDGPLFIDGPGCIWFDTAWRWMKTGIDLLERGRLSFAEEGLHIERIEPTARGGRQFPSGPYGVPASLTFTPDTSGGRWSAGAAASDPQASMHAVPSPSAPDYSGTPHVSGSSAWPATPPPVLATPSDHTHTQQLLLQIRQFSEQITQLTQRNLALLNGPTYAREAILRLAHLADDEAARLRRNLIALHMFADASFATHINSRFKGHDDEWRYTEQWCREKDCAVRPLQLHEEGLPAIPTNPVTNPVHEADGEDATEATLPPDRGEEMLWPEYLLAEVHSAWVAWQTWEAAHTTSAARAGRAESAARSIRPRRRDIPPLARFIFWQRLPQVEAAGRLHRVDAQFLCGHLSDGHQFVPAQGRIGHYCAFCGLPENEQDSLHQIEETGRVETVDRLRRLTGANEVILDDQSLYGLT